MSRPDQLVLVAVVAAIGGSMALADGYTVSPEAAGLAGIALISSWASLHFTNEWADVETDRLTTEYGTRTLFSGGSATVPGVDVPRWWAATAAIVTGFLGASLTLLAWAVGTLPPSGVALQGVTFALGYAYSLPPVNLASRGLGEVANATVGGTVLPLYGYATAAGTVTSTAAIAMIPFTLLVFANMLATQWPDRVADGAVGKRTLPVRWSRHRLRRAFMLSSGGAYVSAFLLWGVLPDLVIISTFAGLPFSLLGVATFTRWHSAAPAVFAMVVVAGAQLLAWSSLAGFLPR